MPERSAPRPTPSSRDTAPRPDCVYVRGFRQHARTGESDERHQSGAEQDHPARGGAVLAGLGVLTDLAVAIGLIAGALAKLILAGKQGGGWIVTLLLGVVGALLGGWLGSIIFHVNLESFFSLSTWLLAIGGSVIMLLIYALIVGRRASR